jgi:hypothetical protein
MTEETLRALKGKMSIKAEDLGLADTKSSVVTYLKGYTFTISRSLDNGCTNYFFFRDRLHRRFTHHSISNLGLFQEWGWSCT